MLQPEKTAGDTAWFVHDRFGMFIHWGTYALAARHEWVQNQEKIAGEEYQKYFDHFDPDLFDPQAWAKAAKAAGMKYFVITAKHHEGFCLWDSQFTDFKSTNTPYGSDLLAPLVEAMRAEGLKVGLYYSLIDWHHEHFPIDGIHPLRDHENAHQLNETRDIKIYAQYMRDQVRELIERFAPEVMWFDFSYPDNEYKGMKGKGHNDWQSKELLHMIREIAPTMMVNNRLDLADVPADMHTPEQFQPTGWIHVDGKPVVWEACQTLSGSWGYHRDETTWKSSGQLIRMLIDTVAKGGNLLMNVGPTSRGTLDHRAQNALQTYADWMQLHARSIYGCTQSEFSPPTDVRYTQNGNRLYVHVFAWPFRYLYLPDLGDNIDYAQLLNDGSEIKLGVRDWFAGHNGTQGGQNDAVLELPVLAPNVEVPVIELFLK